MHTKTNQEEGVIKGFFLGRCIAFVAGDCKLFAVLSEARLGEMSCAFLSFPFLSFGKTDQPRCSRLQREEKEKRIRYLDVLPRKQRFRRSRSNLQHHFLAKPSSRDDESSEEEEEEKTEKEYLGIESPSEFSSSDLSFLQ